MERYAPSKTKEEITNRRLRARDEGALNILGIFALTDRKSRMLVVNLDRLAPYHGAAQGAAGAVGE
jgi:hypothetical protein